MTDAAAIARLFNCQASPYWDNHYHFDRPTPKSSVKQLGRMQADLLIINAWVPLLFVYGEMMGSQQYKDQAVALLEQMGAENNRIVRQWTDAGLQPANAAQSQALIQLKTSYCNSRRCLDCRIGHHVIKQIS